MVMWAEASVQYLLDAKHMKRNCSECGRSGIPVLQVLFPTQIQCAFCQTKYRVSRWENIPYVVIGAVLLLLLAALVLDILNTSSFLVFMVVWLLFDLIWGLFTPLEVTKESASNKSLNRTPGASAGFTDGNGGARELKR